MRKFLSLLVVLLTTFSSAWADGALTTGTAKATIDGEEVDVQWVQLWKDGPMFATRNVGATGATDKESTLGTPMSFTDAAKTGSDYVWGENWKTPTKDEMDLLNTSKVTCSYVQQDGIWGYKYTGVQEGYTNNSLFLSPNVTQQAYTQGQYWTSTANGTNNAYCLFNAYTNNSNELGSYWSGTAYQSTKYYVRPVIVPHYLCFTAEEATDISFNIKGSWTPTATLKYSKDKATWKDYSFTEGDNHTISLTAGEKVYFKATSTNSTFSESLTKCINFTSTGRVSASGNIMSLLDETCESKTIPADYTFCRLFDSCSDLISAPDLPATELKESCYRNMFNGCTNLTTLPILPEYTDIPSKCFNEMFYACSNLVINTTGPGQEWHIKYASANSFSYMFTSTGGTFTGTPVSETTYYIASLPAVKFNSKGYATYSSDKPFTVKTQYPDGQNPGFPVVKPVDVKAYKAKVNGEQIVLTEITSGTNIPAGEGILLYTDDANSVGYAHFEQVSSADAITDNDLMPTTTATDPIVAKPTTGTIWALDNENSFQEYTGSAFIANRAYLRTNVPAAKGMTLVFGDETTGVNNVNANVDANQARDGKYIENGRIVILQNGKKYNTAGQQVK